MNGDLPVTERADERTRDLDALDTFELVTLLAREQQRAVDAVSRESEEIAQAVETIAQRMRDGGRLHYAGAGTSGRLGVLDASEMPPTFGVDADLVCAHIAGGTPALTRAIEGAEEDAHAGEAAVRDHVEAPDALIGLSASGGAPFVVHAVREARRIGAWTLAVTSNPESALAREADCAIVLATGPEPLTGSTRLLAGTAQKIFLNTVSTAVMVRLGKVHGNLMVDVVASNAKLRKRALRLVMQLASCDAARAESALADSGWRVKTAVLVARSGLAPSGAERLLAEHRGNLRASLAGDPAH